jgi:serine acetyltransferase
MLDFMTTWRLICADLASGWNREVPSSKIGQLRLVLSCAVTVRGAATIGFRISHAVGRHSATAGAILKQLNQIVTGCDIACETQIGPGFRMFHPNGVVIHPATVIGSRFTIQQGVTLGGTSSGAPVIGDDVDIAPGARVLGPVVIGHHVRVGANAVLTHTIEGDFLVLAGVPARILREAHLDEFFGSSAVAKGQ